MDLIYDGCNANQYVYYNELFGLKGGPTRSDV